MKNNLTFFLSTLISLLISSSISAQGTCITTSTTAAQGYLSVGIKTTFETLANGTDVKITYQLLDVDKTVDIAYLWNPAPNFFEVQMTNVGVNTFSITLNNQAGIITKACKFVINGGGQIESNYLDYEVNTDCSATNDVIAPDTFTASTGATTAFSIELLLNANDASGDVVYRVNYNGIQKAISAPAGVEKSFLITGLDASTNYNFNVTASDLAGNQAANNPILLSESTIEDTSTDCEGTSDDAEQGTSFAIGYNYSFVTTGTDVIFTFELLDTDKIGVIAYLWRAPPQFLETQMDNVSGTNIFTKTVNNQTVGEVVNYACKFAYQGGLSITKYFSYEVGEDCSLGTEDFETMMLRVFPNPTMKNWRITNNTSITSVVLYNVFGKQIISIEPNSTEVEINASLLNSGIYFAKIEGKNRYETMKLIKK
jgi:hypothetical protein